MVKMLTSSLRISWIYRKAILLMFSLYFLKILDNSFVEDTITRNLKINNVFEINSSKLVKNVSIDINILCYFLDSNPKAANRFYL